MKKFYLLAAALVMALSSVSCANEVPVMDEPAQSHNVKKVGNDDEFYIVTPEEFQIITCLVNTSFCCDAMSEDLLAYDPVLYANAKDPEHECLMCRLKALKFFYNHLVYGDTTAECDLNDIFEDMLVTNLKLRAVWETIEL